MVRVRPCGTKSPYTYEPPFYGLCLAPKGHSSNHWTLVEYKSASGQVTREKYFWWMEKDA